MGLAALDHWAHTLEVLELVHFSQFEGHGLDRAAEMFPALTHVSMSATGSGQRIEGERLTELLQPDLAARIEGLKLYLHKTDALSSLIGRSLPSLSTLDVFTADPSILAALVGNLPRLERLSAWVDHLTADLAEALGDLPLRELNLVISKKSRRSSRPISPISRSWSCTATRAQAASRRCVASRVRLGCAALA